MSNVTQPRGPLPPNVYRRRRIVVLVALVLALVLLVIIVRAVMGAFSGGDDQAAPTATTSPSATASGSPSASTSPTASGTETAAGACSSEAVKVTPTAAAKTVKAGEATKVGMTIENVSDAACSLDAGSGNLELVISSGSERIWSSDDCQKAGESRPTDVAPKAKLESTVEWAVNRSAQGCPTDLSELKAGTYTLKARVGDINSEGLNFTVES